LLGSWVLSVVGLSYSTWNVGIGGVVKAAPGGFLLCDVLGVKDSMDAVRCGAWRVRGVVGGFVVVWMGGSGKIRWSLSLVLV